MIEAINLTKKFNNLVAVDSVNLNIEAGQIFGLLGPNAAGKTTIIRMLCSIIKNDDGEVKINNMRADEAKSNFGYVAQHFGQYEELSVWENIKFYAQMYDVTDEEHLASLMERYGLTPFKDKFAGSLSGGYQRRLALVCALAHNPKVLFLDEPTAGIDPVTRKLLWDDFYRLSAEGKTLFVTTHYMEEAQRCNQLAFLSSGKIVAQGTPESIKEALGESVVYVTKTSYNPELTSALENMDDIILINQFGNELRIIAKPELSQESINSTISSIIGASVYIEVSQANLEDVFIALTQKNGISND